MAQHKKLASAKTGMLPGSPVYVGEHPPHPTLITIHIYDSESYQNIKIFDPALVQASLKAGKHIWIDVSGLANHEAITSIGALFAIHPLVIEDILNTRQRPKLDVFGDSLFIVFKLLQSDTTRLTYQTEQCCLYIQNNVLLTFRESDNFDLTPLCKRLGAEHSLIREHGSNYLTYLLMDSIVDDYFNFVEEAALSLEKMEDLLITMPETIKLEELYTIKRRTLTLRKTIAPLIDIVHLLLVEHGRLIGISYQLYYRDLHDHCIRLMQSVDLHREMTTGMLDIYLSTLNTRMNETMKVLTLFASIFIPLTFVAGLYGMNFQYMPELKWRYAYPAVLTGMGALVLAMMVFFKRRKLL